MKIFVDVDETICLFGKKEDYTTAIPIPSNISKINRLYDVGHTIVYWTARGSTTGINWFLLTLNQLNKWGAKFHELRMGKPNYDLIICNKSKRIDEI